MVVVVVPVNSTLSFTALILLARADNYFLIILKHLNILQYGTY